MLTVCPVARQRRDIDAVQTCVQTAEAQIEQQSYADKEEGRCTIEK